MLKGEVVLLFSIQCWAVTQHLPSAQSGGAQYSVPMEPSCAADTGKKFPLEQANEALAESQREARGPKVFLEG